MKIFIPYEKLSKKMQRLEDKKHRGNWGDINPVTRKSPDPKVYNRRAEKRRIRERGDE